MPCPFALLAKQHESLDIQVVQHTYKVRKDGWLKPYEVTIQGKKYLDLHPKGHSPLDQHLKGILQWRPSNPIRKMNYMDA